jgi:hypothetical protein
MIDLAALAGDGQGPVSALRAGLLDAGTGGLRDQQPFSASRQMVT